MTQQHKYESAQDWLQKNKSDEKVLERIWSQLVPRVDADTIQDIYEDLMDRDGFFDE